MKGVTSFKLSPLPGAVVGPQKIAWIKEEDTEETKFSQIPDTYFTLVATAPYKSLKAILGSTISRTALGGVSLPITITLSQPPS
jgi:hypothetical protein